MMRTRKHGIKDEGGVMNLLEVDRWWGVRPGKHK